MCNSDVFPAPEGELRLHQLSCEAEAVVCMKPLKRSSLTASFVLFRSSNWGQRGKSRTGRHLTAALYSPQPKQFPVENDCINQLHHLDLNHSVVLCFPDLMMWECRVRRLALLRLVLCFSCTVPFAATCTLEIKENICGVSPTDVQCSFTQKAGGLHETSLRFMLTHTHTLVLAFALHRIESRSVVIVGVPLCFLNSVLIVKRVADVGTTNTQPHRLWNTMARIWFTPQIPAEAPQQKPLLHTLTLTQIHMCPWTLHTLRKTLCKHLFCATGNLSAVKAQSICVDPALISSSLAA